MQSEAGYDYIVVGGGTAGCVLAERLSRDPAAAVLLLEAGGPRDDIRFRIPLAFTQLWGRKASTWGLATAPEPGLDGRSLPIPRGKVLGGTSSINGMIFNHGQPGDYDQWAASGLDGWSYSELLPYFRAQEANWRGESDRHGARGPVGVSLHGHPSGLLADALAATAAAGYPLTQDFVAPVSEGMGLPDFNIRRGRRVSADIAFLDPARRRRNLTVVTGALVERVIVEKGHARAVVAHVGSTERRFSAAREVILAAGALKSPHILELSGIGDATRLRAAGIAVTHHLRGVGEGLNDQPACSFDFPCRAPVAFDSELRADRMALSAARWLLAGRGPFTSPPMVCSGILRMLDGATRPDVRVMVNAVAMDARIWFPGLRRPRGHILMGAFSLCYPRSRGGVHARSASAGEAPVIAYNLLSDPKDLADMRHAYREMRRIFAQQPLARHLGPMERPADEPRTDAEIDAFIRRMGATTHHPVGSCRMGLDEASVVDARGRIHGIEGLRVIDASIFPTQIAGNPTALVMAMAAKLADDIRG